MQHPFSASYLKGRWHLKISTQSGDGGLGWGGKMLAPLLWEEVISDTWLSLRWLLVFLGFIFHKACGRAWRCQLPSLVQLPRSCLFALQSPGHCALAQHCLNLSLITGGPGWGSPGAVPVGWGCFQCRRKMMLIRGLVDGIVTDDYSSYNSRQQSCPVCLQ